MWNELPNNITSREYVYKFKGDLKKYLYCNLASLTFLVQISKKLTCYSKIM